MKRPTGKLYTSNPNSLRYLDGEADIWQITRRGILISGAIPVRTLAPSEELFRKYLTQWQKLPPDQWWPYYEEYFRGELESEEKLSGLRVLYKALLVGKSIVLLCFCKEAQYCHRRLVGEYFLKYDIEATELVSTDPKQLSIFDGVV